jgi:hypothetical protein
MLSEGILANLCHEHCSRWDFHVVAKLEVLQKGYGLCHANVAVHLEAHVSNRISRVDIPNYILSDDVQAWCLS